MNLIKIMETQVYPGAKQVIIHGCDARKLLAFISASEKLSVSCEDPIFPEDGGVKWCGTCRYCAFNKAYDKLYEEEE